VSPEIRALIRKLSKANPLWDPPRIVGELRKFGIDVAKSTVEKYRVRPRKPSSPTWKAFLENHVSELITMDLFVVHIVDFKVLSVFVFLAHDRRRVVDFNVTAHPAEQWTAQQLVEAFPWGEAPRFLLLDRDSLYGASFQRRVSGLGIEEVRTAPRSPWQNPFVERFIGSIRRDCLDPVIVLNERHLKRLLSRYFDYYHRWRTHRS
jgi:transposase InsO family protein